MNTHQSIARRLFCLTLTTAALVCGLTPQGYSSPLRRAAASATATAAWVAVNNGLTNLGISALAISPAAPSTVYAAGSGAVFKSTDGGESWRAFNDGLPYMSVNALSLAPGNPNTLYAATPGGVFKVVDETDGPNPIDDPRFFVRRHYLDFFGREPEAPGLAFWTGEIERCGTNAGCREAMRVNVSAAFFLSIEFQRTGYQVMRIYKASFTDGPSRPRGLPRIDEFLRDTREAGGGVVVGVQGWESQLAASMQAFARRWVGTAEFVARFPEDMRAGEYVDQLFADAGAAPTEAERAAAVAAFGAGGAEGRAQALLSVTDSASVFNRQYNEAFVLMQYVGYLRRNPNDTPDAGYEGFDYWLGKLDSFTRDGEDARDEAVALARVRRAEMVNSFLSSTEYRRRFGRP